MEELETFTSFLFGESKGWVYAPVKYPNRWEQNFFHWPLNKQALHDHIKVNGSEGDVYLAPALFKKKEAKKEEFASSNTVWIDIDGVDAIDFKNLPKPSAIVQTSTASHVHCYWQTGEIKDRDALEEVNKRLAYYIREEGGDVSGWDCTQLLRPPTTNNIKRGGVPVELVYFEPSINTFSNFDSAPAIKIEHVELTEADIGDVEELLKSGRLLSSLRKRIRTETPKEGDRSQFYYKIAHELAESGFQHGDISTILVFLDDRIGKFRDRPDRLTRISEIASLAIHSIYSEEKPSLYSVVDILNHSEELDWYWDNWLHSNGIMMIASEPGVGKTQFALDFSYNLSTDSEEFLGMPIPAKPLRSLIFSLEMDQRALKIVMKKQLKGVKLDLLAKNWASMDEVSSAVYYEELIEEFNPDVLIIDSLLELSEESLKEEDSAKALNRWLKRMRKKYNTAIVLIHHMRKAGSGNKAPSTLNDVYGTVVVAKDIDTAWALWVPDETKPDEIDLIAVKARFKAKETIEIERTENLLFRQRESVDSGESERPTGNSKANLFFN